MKKEALAQFNQPGLILLGFILFFVCFLGLVYWTYRKSSKAHFEKMAQLPLEKGLKQ